MRILKKLGLVGTAMALCLTTGIVPTRADTVVPYDRQLIMRKASTVSEVGVAFLKTANNYPDFNVIVDGMPEYQKLDPLAKGDFKSKEVAKLQAAFLAFSPKRSDLIVRVGVKAMFHQAKDGSGTLDIQPPSDGPFYFPFYFANYPIAMIVDGIDLFRHIDLTKEEAQIVYNRIGLDGAATLLLQVYPVAADDKNPVMMDDIPQYPLLTEIGYIGLINTRTEQIWAWKSSKYGRKSNLLPKIMTEIPKASQSGAP